MIFGFITDNHFQTCPRPYIYLVEMIKRWNQLFTSFQ